jgi:outer membrane protein
MAQKHMEFMKATVLLGLVLVGQVCGQTTNNVPRRVSLQDCIRMALEHNLDVQIERYTPQIARLNLSGSYGAYDPVFAFSAKEDSLSMPGEIDPKRTNPDVPYDLNTETYSSSLSGRLPTGLTYELAGSTDFLTADTQLTPSLFYPTGLRHTNEYQAFAALLLKQPLLKDFWMDQPRLNIRINKKNLSIAELALRQQLINTVTKVQVAYCELIFAFEKVKVEEKALELAKQVLADNRVRLQAGKLRPLEEKQSEAQAATFEADVVAARQALADQQNALKSLLNDDFKSWPDEILEPSEPLVAVAQPFIRSESWDKAMRLRPDLAQLRLDLEKRDLLVRYNYNQLFPSLDLVGSYGGRAVRDNLGDTFGDLGNTSFPAYSYGVVLSLPLSNRTQRNNYKASQAARKQAALQQKKLEQEILVQVDNAGKLTQTTYQRVGSTHQARIYAEAALEAENVKLSAGMTTSFFVLQLQRNLTDARSSEIRALADHQKALIQLAFSEGSILEKNRLNVESK